MSAQTDARHAEEQSNSWRKAEIDQQIMDSKSDYWWVRKHFGEKIKMTGNLVFSKTPEDFLMEIARQNKLIAEGLQ